MKTVKPLGCPFCGDAPHIKKSDFQFLELTTWWMQCRNLDCSIKPGFVFIGDKKDGIKKWNVRNS